MAAKRLGVSQAKLSKIEAGLKPISDELLKLMVIEFAYPDKFFYADYMVLGPGSSEFFHRKRQSLTGRRLSTIHAEINIRIMTIMQLLSAVELQNDNIPECLIEDGWKSPSEIARSVRAQWKLPPGPIQNMVEVIENAGGIVIECDFGTSLIDAISRYVPGLPHLFFVDKNLPGDRLRMTLAHELGHAIMHRLPYPEMENQAFEFAAEFLMPEKQIRSQFDKVNLAKLADMKPYWKVSMSALLMRAQALEKVPPGQAQYLWRQFSKFGLKVREPVELDIPREEPRLLAEIIELHRKELGYGLRELSDLLKISEHEVQALYAINPTKDEVKARLRSIK